MFDDMDVARTPEKDRMLGARTMRRIISGAFAIGTLAIVDLEQASVAVAQTPARTAPPVASQPSMPSAHHSSRGTRRLTVSANSPPNALPNIPSTLPNASSNTQSNSTSGSNVGSVRDPKLTSEPSGPVRIAQEPRLVVDPRTVGARPDSVSDLLTSEPLSVARDTLYPPSSLPPVSPNDLNSAVESELLEPMEPERIWPIRKYTPQEATPVESTRTSPLSYLPPQRPIGQISIDVRSKPKGTSNDLPEDLAQQTTGNVPTVVAARADEMYSEPMYAAALDRAHEFPYQPLYFEEINLERYGRSNCGVLQPAASGLRFFATIPSLPYAMTVHKPNQTYHWRWPYEAGWGAPRVRELRPLELKPSLVQAAAVSGLIFVVP